MSDNRGSWDGVFEILESNRRAQTYKAAVRLAWVNHWFATHPFWWQRWWWYALPSKARDAWITRHMEREP